MPRPKRVTIGNIAYHVLNRANGRLRIFKKPRDFEAFEEILAQGIDRFNMRLCSYCIMSNHWHLVLWPRHDGDLPQFMKWITLTHTQRWHAAHLTTGTGHLYQGRYKSFPIQQDEHYLTVMRYVEANPLRANIVDSARDWPWSSFALRTRKEKPFELSKGPLALPRNWTRLVNRTIDPNEFDKFKNCIERGAPFGSEKWTTQIAAKLNLKSTLRPRGRPKKSF